LGFDPTFQSAIALKVVEQAVGGNLRAVELIASISTNNKDSLDKKEQRERIKALELENDRRRNVLSNVDKTENALAEYFEKLDEVVNNDT
ncbi:TPA: stress-induced protein, partial [Streptococcus pyogenes]|nr:stress-induced protein [Streptococcus pyogenes]